MCRWATIPGLDGWAAGGCSPPMSNFKGEFIHVDYCGGTEAGCLWVPGYPEEALRQLHRGQVVASGFRRVLRQHNPGDGAGDVPDCAVEGRGHRQGTGCGPRGQGGVGQHLRSRAWPAAGADRTADRGQPGDAGDDRDLGQRQAHPRDDGGGPAAGGGPLPLLRGRDPRAGRFDRPNRFDDRGVPLPSRWRRARA